MAWDRHIGAVFADRSAAEGAVDALRAAGLAEEHLGAALRHDEDLVFDEDVEREVAVGVETGVVIGAPLGAIGGMALLAVVVPGIGTIGLAGVLAAGAAVGGLAGTFLGALLGLETEERLLDEEWHWERVDLEPGEVLVVVGGHGHPVDVADVLVDHGGRLVARPT